MSLMLLLLCDGFFVSLLLALFVVVGIVTYILYRCMDEEQTDENQKIEK